MPPGGFLQKLEVFDERKLQVHGIVGPIKTRHRRKPGALDVVSTDGLFDHGVGGPNPLEVFELCAKGVDSIRNEREEKSVGFMDRQCLHCPSSIISRQVGALKIHGAKSIDLNIEET